MMATVAFDTPARRRDSTRRRRRRAWPAWKLALAGLLLFGGTAGTIWLLAPHRSAAPPPAPTPQDSARTLAPERVQHMIDQMAQRVQQAPQDASSWAMLAHSQEMLGRFDEAAKAYAKLAELRPDDAQVLADYADALAVSQGRRFDGEPKRLLQRALARDPKNLKALLLSGSEAFDRQAYAEAITHWDRARALATDPADLRRLDSGLAEARALAPRGKASAAPAKPAAAAIAGTVAGRITLAPELQARVQPDDTLFVFARPTLGSRMPVALLRRKARDLPLDFRLDDTMAMVPAVKLSAMSEVVVGARISRRGDATPTRGDLQGLTAPVAVGSRDLKLEIREVLP